MARINNLPDFLTDVATAIKTKKGDNTDIPAANFDTEITNLPSQGVYQNKQMNITTNGNYEITPDTGYDAMEKVRLNVTANEDLDNVLTAQEQKLVDLELLVNTKSAGKGADPNIFVQTTEPEIQKGLWLQADKPEPTGYIYKDVVFTGGEWVPDGIITRLPTGYDRGWSATIGTNIYLFSFSYKTYKYDTLTNTYTTLRDVPYAAPGYGQGAAVVGTDIYLLGTAYNNGNTNYKYDTLTDTYTQLTNIPYRFSRASVAAVGTDIHLFGGETYYYYHYKYNTLTDTYTKLSNIPYNFREGYAVAVGTDVYLLGSSSSPYKNENYRYNTLTDKYTKLADIPFKFANGVAVNIGTYIYLLGSSYTTNKNENYRYNILTNTYEKLEDVPYQLYSSGIGHANGRIYIFGGEISGTNQNARAFVLESDTYEQDNLVVINQGKYGAVGYDVELFSNTKSLTPPVYPVADVYYYTIEDGLDDTIPTYYGDGTQWIKFKN